MTKPTPRQLAVLAALACVIAGACLVMGHPISRDTSHFWRMVLAGVGVGLIGARAYLASAAETVRDRAMPWFWAALVVICTTGWFNYYQFDKKVALGIDDYTDITYYYLNSKYLDELGYYGFYAAMLVADQEVNDRHTHAITKYRDLRDDTVKPVAVGLEHGHEIERTRFTPERWKEFQRDNDYLLARKSTADMKDNFYVDHGYNPPPTWSIIGGTIADFTPVEDLKWIASIDVLLVIGMFAAVAWGFGLEPMLWAMVFFLCTFSGRWPILGQALLRFDWITALVVGQAALRREKWATAGASLAYAAMNRVFPAIFLGAWLFAAIGDVWRERRIATKHLRFAAAALVVVVALTGASLARYGVATFEESADNLAMHNRSFSSHRVGLAGLLVYKGETTRAEINANGGMANKEIAVQAMMPALHVIGLLAVAFVAFVAIRTRRDPWETLPWLILPMFILTNPQVNYYNLRLVAVIWHAAHLGTRADVEADGQRRYHSGALAILLGLEAAVQWTKTHDWDRHATNSVASLGMAVYLVVLIAWLIGEAARPVPQVAPAK